MEGSRHSHHHQLAQAAAGAPSSTGALAVRSCSSSRHKFAAVHTALLLHTGRWIQHVALGGRSGRGPFPRHRGPWLRVVAWVASAVEELVFWVAAAASMVSQAHRGCRRIDSPCRNLYIGHPWGESQADSHWTRPISTVAASRPRARHAPPVCDQTAQVAGCASTAPCRRRSRGRPLRRST